MSIPPSPTKCVICKPPKRLESIGTSVFLAGSIEMGTATDWQRDITSALSDLPVTIFNPRRDNWDKSWKQDISNPQFKEQVVWEMDHLDEVDVIILNFEPGTKSPISLLELGIYANSGRLVVCCPEGFWKRGNVQVVCDRYGIPLVETMEELTEQVRKRLEETMKKRRFESIWRIEGR
ncbi:hypothetical protein K469DRAFT_734458 [Zopfia rhizophila CBS 207.26]|uniref:Nucleoside 2-deoxyribosyltransferase domain-containing protein n=1 Tax=Zopfia rhizophila CBS 207.26 TaxID=1314779 RepID=A0A6A6ERA8_9PEZI|nr:hypothetical protein K469DRAFT_734458 [Zopfia rhizophila CBS 207.26]